MIKLLHSIILITLLFSCSSPEERADVMPESKFVKVMTDVYLADAMVSYRIGEDFNDRFENYGYYKSVFEKHNVSKEDFIKAYDFYSSDIDRFDLIVTKVMNQINMEADKANQAK